MIPKKIHYIWLGNKSKPALAEICIMSWRRNCPDYEIVEWNETNLNIAEIEKNNAFFRECKRRKMWAFMADYLRFMILYQYGGIYLDTDMLLLKSLDEFLENELFIGKEDQETISAGIIGCERNNNIIKTIFDYYENEIWKVKKWIVTDILTSIFNNNEYTTEKIVVYNNSFFYPYCYNEEYTPNCIGENTYSIHWWSKSWGKSLREHVFLQTKHVHNPILRNILKVRKIIGFYYYKFKFEKGI